MPPFILWITILVAASVLCLAEKRIVTLHLPKFRQEDDVDTHYYLAPMNSTGSCTRECRKGDHRICYYSFHIENYAVLSAACGNCIENEEDCYLPQCVTADGYERGILTANRRLPGPSIQVCYGDRIIVDVVNAMLSRTVTIHWHGIIQRNKNFMDGVPFINQCPIDEDTSFRYDFRADTAGTMYWHAHSELHLLNGLQGSLIVRVPKEYEPHHHLYDFDMPAHSLFVMDWFHMDADNKLPGLIRSEARHLTLQYLINGRGRVRDETNNNKFTTTPLHVFYVKKGYRYRFRLTAATGTECPGLLQIEGHKLLVIATDGSPIEPVLVDSLQFFTGERYDFVLHADKEIHTYWIQVRSMESCFQRDVCQLALLKYEGSTEKEPLSPVPSLKSFRLGDTMLNPLNASCGPKAVCLSQLTSVRRVSERITNKKPDISVELTFGFYFPGVKAVFQSGKYPLYIQLNEGVQGLAHMNNIQLLMPPSPLTSQYNDIASDRFCANTPEGLPACHGNATFCSCVSILKIPLGSVVQFVLIDKSVYSTVNHPFHLHGGTYNVIAMGYLPQKLMNGKDIAQLIENGKIAIPPSPIFKDTTPVPSKGYLVIRFIANNPGFWFFHCHFVYHHATGMGVVLQVGETYEFPSLPRGFPKCGDYLPPVRMMVITKGRQTVYPHDYDKNNYRINKRDIMPNWRRGTQDGVAVQDVKEDEEEELPSNSK